MKARFMWRITSIYGDYALYKRKPHPLLVDSKSMRIERILVVR